MYEDPTITAKQQPGNTDVLEASNELEDFLETIFQNPSTKYATFSFPVDAPDPLAYLEMNWEETSFQYYWEKPSNKFAIAAGDELINIESAGEHRFQDVQSKFETLKKSTAEFTAISHPFSGMFLLGGFSFFDDLNNELWKSFAPASFSIPRWIIIQNGKFNLATFGVRLESFESPSDLKEYLADQIEHIQRTITTKSEHDSNNEIKQSLKDTLTPNKSEYEKWISSVNKAKELIKQKRFKKIVLAREVTVSKSSNVSPTQILNKLRRQYTNCYSFLYHNSTGDTFIGSTPERLGAFRNRLFLTEALAGSIQRGDTATEDAKLAKQLSRSSKNISEHNFVVKDIENRLQPYVTSMKRNSSPEVKKLSNVQHLYTPVRAKLNDETTIMEIINQLHPTPAVGGYPWQQAAPYLKEFEQFERGWYAGPIGWFNTNGTGEFAVAIRSGLLKQTQVHFFAGCGIVEDSDPTEEWEETNLKLNAMLTALQYD